MTRRLLAAAVCLLMILPATVATAQSEEQANQGAAELDVYEAEVGPGDDVALRKEGFDVLDTEVSSVNEKNVPTLNVELVLSKREVAQLRREGVEVTLKTNDEGLSVARAAAQEAQQGFEVWRPWSGPGGLQEEMEQVAAQYPRLTKLVTIGESLQGKPIYALKVTTDPTRRDGRKPAVLYASTQHAREWITPEVNRRLMHHYLENYGRDRRVTDLVRNNELWFILVANPDGYDFTFTGTNRNWRKNLRDNNNDGQITANDGVDLNRNFPYRWGYDNEGSSVDPSSQTYRGTGPASEPETQALDAFFERVGFEFLVNYHSAAELLLYGIGWQVATPSPDDRIYEAMAGTDENPAIPGYDPDISAELYTTNGDTDTHAQALYSTLGFTPELDTCKSATLLFDDDEWEPEFCDDKTVFEFPDDENLVQAVFEKNLPFALAVADSAGDPANPVSPVGLRARDFYIDAFEVSHGSSQTVAVEAKRELKDKRLRYRINGRRTQTAKVSEWRGGEKYGDENDDYYAEYRGTVKGARAGDTVEVWFEARKGRNTVASEHFTYEVTTASRAPVLVIANEDYTGVNPEQSGGPNALPAYTGALEDLGVEYEVWDADQQGVPHDLGVLSHYQLVVWETGADRIAQDPEDEEIFINEPELLTPGEYPDVGVKESQQSLMLAVRDYLNEGGKLFHAGENAGYFGIFGSAIGGLFYGLNGAPDQECVVEQSEDQLPGEAFFGGDCLIYSDDFYQYYLGAYSRTTVANPPALEGVEGPFAGLTGAFGGPGLEANPLDEAGNYLVTSEVLPPDEFPQFASARALTYGAGGGGPGPFDPIDGQFYVGALHADNSFMRLQRTIDVPAEGGQLQFSLSYNVEQAFDHVIVEAETISGGQPQGDRTTLPDVNAGTSTEESAACDQYPDGLHTSLLVYAGIGCEVAETTGTWNSFTGSSDGWTEVAFDLSDYAGQQVQISISYVTDGGVGGIGAFVDNVRVPGEDPESFEEGLGAWTIPGAPAGSPSNTVDWQRAERLFNPAAGVTTEDTVLFGFGLEHIEDPQVRAAALQRALDHLN